MAIIVSCINICPRKSVLAIFELTALVSINQLKTFS